MKTGEVVPFVDQVEVFNRTFGKLVNTKPTIPSKAEMDFIYNFVIEEVSEMRDAHQANNIVEVLDAILDLIYVAVGMPCMSFGLKEKVNAGFAEVHASNMSKFCKTEQEAKDTVVQRSIDQNEPCHYEKLGDIYIVYRTRDLKIMKSINYFKPNLTQFFTEEEIEKAKNNVDLF